MLLIKDIKTRLRERRERIENSYIVSEFILKMKEYNIVLSKKEEYILECHDLNFSHDIKTFEFDIRNETLVINYNHKPNLIVNIFNGYFNIKYKNNDISLQKIFRRIIDNLSTMNNEYYQLLRIDERERRGYVELEKTLW